MTPPLLPPVELRCAACGAAEILDLAGMIERLRRLGMLRRDPNPDRRLVAELFRGAADGRMACAACGERQLTVQQPREAEAAWHQPRRCENCGAPIPRERLSAIPGATRCVACQAAGQPPSPPQEDDFCPHCGAVMHLVPSRAGITRFVLACPACGKKVGQ